MTDQVDEFLQSEADRLASVAAVQAADVAPANATGFDKILPAYASDWSARAHPHILAAQAAGQATGNTTTGGFGNTVNASDSADQTDHRSGDEKHG